MKELQQIIERYESDLEQLNLDVAAIAGWTDIKSWDNSPQSKVGKKTFVGTNAAHPELGHFVPNYVGSIDAIAKVLELMDIDWSTSSRGYALHLCTPKDGKPFLIETYGQTAAIALCKLLLQLAPKPKPQVQIIDDGGH